MNCKPGDLAVIVGSRKSIEVIGSIIRILDRGPDWRGYATWVSTPARDGSQWHRDCVLRPIRPDESPEQSLEAMRDLMQTKKEKVTT